jgi:hypothetical protein
MRVKESFTLHLRVEAEGLMLSPSGNSPTRAEVAMRGDGSLELAVYRKDVSLADLGVRRELVPHGQIMTISPRVSRG